MGMKKILLGVLLGLLLCPIKCQAYQPQKAIEIEYTDAQLLLKVAQAEAGNQGYYGMWMVMSVVLNRVESEEFPNTIEEVIYQPNQFATAGYLDKIEPSSDSHYALAMIESGEVAKNIIAFESVKSNSLERYFWKAFDFRDHSFYTLKK